MGVGEQFVTGRPFTIQADFELGERARDFAVTGGGDVVIARGEVPAAIPDPVFSSALAQAAPGRFLLRHEGRFRLLAENGARITYHCEAACHWDELVLFLMGSGLGAIAYQRGLLPLHASAVAKGDRVFAFCGESGAGKSTLAAALAGSHAAFFSDDILLVDPTPGPRGVMCHAGQKDMKLWRDAFDLVAAERGDPVVAAAVGGANRDKHFAGPERLSAYKSGLLEQIWFLETSGGAAGAAGVGAEGTIAEPLPGERVGLVLANLYSPVLASTQVTRATLYRMVAAIVPRIGFLRYTRPHSRSDFARQVALVARRIERDRGEQGQAPA